MITFKTKSEAVFEGLRQKIFNSELKPGQRIVISEVAKEFGTSEIPIREAIRRFESEGLVTVTPHVGPIVSVLKNCEFIEIYLMRIELESLATKLAAPHMRESDINDLKKIICEEERAVLENEYSRLGPLNKEFHLRIYQTGPYPNLFKSIVDLWGRYELAQKIFAYAPNRVIPSLEEHKMIVDALAENNGTLAAKLVRKQKNKTKKAIEKVFRNNGNNC